MRPLVRQRSVSALNLTNNASRRDTSTCGTNVNSLLSTNDHHRHHDHRRPCLSPSGSVLRRGIFGATVPLMMGRRSRRRTGESSGDGKALKRPRAVVRIPKDGVPDVAKVYPELYEELLAVKVADMEQMIQDTLAAANGAGDGDNATILPPTEVFRSPEEAFRMRANFKIWRSGDADTGFSTDYVMFERDDSRTPVQVTHYPMGSPLVQTLMEPILTAIRDTNELREAINDVRFLTTLKGDALVTITYNRPIGDAWVDAIESLVQTLPRAAHDTAPVKFVGRSRKIKLIVGEDGDTVDEALTVPHILSPLLYRQTEGAFSQPNAAVCQKMLGWAYSATAPTTVDGEEEEKHDLCELYCGNGCFTVALAGNFRRVVATEMSKASVELARFNLERNGVENVKVARLNAEDFVEAYEGRRKFRRLEDAGIIVVGGRVGEDDGEEEGEAEEGDETKEGDETEEGNEDSDEGKEGMTFDRLQTLFVDPPRAGLDETCRNLAVQFDRIVYVSCNPETLVRDIAELLPTHEVVRVAAFDQFPYTPHLEAGVVLKRRRSENE